MPVISLEAEPRTLISQKKRCLSINVRACCFVTSFRHSLHTKNAANRRHRHQSQVHVYGLHFFCLIAHEHVVSSTKPSPYVDVTIDNRGGGWVGNACVRICTSATESVTRTRPQHFWRQLWMSLSWKCTCGFLHCRAAEVVSLGDPWYNHSYLVAKNYYFRVLLLTLLFQIKVGKMLMIVK